MAPNNVLRFTTIKQKTYNKCTNVQMFYCYVKSLKLLLQTHWRNWEQKYFYKKENSFHLPHLNILNLGHQPTNTSINITTFANVNYIYIYFNITDELRYSLPHLLQSNKIRIANLYAILENRFHFHFSLYFPLLFLHLYESYVTSTSIFVGGRFSLINKGIPKEST